jgi:hypothetical protein
MDHGSLVCSVHPEYPRWFELGGGRGDEFRVSMLPKWLKYAELEKLPGRENLGIYIYTCIFLYMYYICIIYIWVNCSDLTATEPWNDWYKSANSPSHMACIQVNELLFYIPR